MNCTFCQSQAYFLYHPVCSLIDCYRSLSLSRAYLVRNLLYYIIYIYMYGMVWYCIVLYYIYRITFHCIALHCITLYSIVFCCIAKLMLKLKRAGSE